MSITSTGSIASALRPGLAGFVLAAAQQPLVCKQIFKKRNSDKNYEQEVEIALLGLGREKPEGTEMASDAMRQTFNTTYINRAYGLMFIITHEAISDNLYMNDFPTQADALKDSMLQLQEVNSASVLNNAFSSSFPIGDGQPLISTAHPLANGTTQSNGVTVAIGLNESATQDFVSQIKKIRAASGLFDNVSASRYIVPTELEYNANRMLHSLYRPATANNDEAVIPQMKLLPQGVISWRYLTSSSAWFIQTDATKGLTWFDREALNMDTVEEPKIKAVTVTAYQRYSFGVSNFRCIVGTSGVA